MRLFVPGGVSLRNMMLPHGPDRAAFEHASNEPIVPVKQTDTMQFMSKTRFPHRLTQWAATEMPLQDDYVDIWSTLEKKFDGTPDRACRDPVQGAGPAGAVALHFGAISPTLARSGGVERRDNQGDCQCFSDPP